MYRKALPQVSSDSLFLTDGGLETFLIYKKGLDLPQFAAFPALKDEEGKKFIKEYYTNYYKVRSFAGYPPKRHKMPIKET